MYLNPSPNNNVHVRIILNASTVLYICICIYILAYFERLLHLYLHAVPIHTHAALSAEINTILMYSDEYTPVKVIRYVLRVGIYYYMYHTFARRTNNAVITILTCNQN